MRALGLREPVGEALTLSFGDHVLRFEIVGVIADFNFQPLHKAIKPFALMISSQEEMKYLMVRVAPGDVGATLMRIEKAWHKSTDGAPFESTFLDQHLAQIYRSEERLAQIFEFFVAMALIVACLGLFALASFSAERRSKEIGVRKVLGATAANIAVLLSGEFARLVLLANAIAWPLAYWWVDKWLQNFAYRTELGWELFVIGGALALGVALLTVGGQAIRAALANPVEALRYE